MRTKITKKISYSDAQDILFWKPEIKYNWWIFCSHCYDQIICFYLLLFRWLNSTLSRYWRSLVCLCDCLCESECWLKECCCCALDRPHFLVNFTFVLFYSSRIPHFSQSYLQCQNFLTSNVRYLKGIKILFMTVRCNFKCLFVYLILWGWMF